MIPFLALTLLSSVILKMAYTHAAKFVQFCRPLGRTLSIILIFSLLLAGVTRGYQILTLLSGFLK